MNTQFIGAGDPASAQIVVCFGDWVGSADSHLQASKKRDAFRGRRNLLGDAGIVAGTKMHCAVPQIQASVNLCACI